MADHAGDHSGQAVSEGRVAGVGDRRVERGQEVAERAWRETIVREQAREIGAIPGDEGVDLRRTGAQQRASGSFRGQEAGGMPGRTEPVNGAAQQQDVAQGPGADEKRPQIT